MEYNIRTIDAVRDADALIAILESGAAIPLVVTGASMMPFLRHGRDTVHLQKKDRYRRGRILFFRRRNGDFILHRLRRILPDGRFLMNGDAQDWCETVAPEQVLAEVVSVTRNGRTRSTDSPLIRLRDLLWYPTRPVRPLFWRLVHVLRHR